ncbi:GNAT family N-acetyltransferase [Salisediminibacterium halotolerans]|uniref:ElaA protein n=1 Tax=Salisediminibacterium halotolerans TaxID=517425 RepID=A0A1H9UIQ8_9BACI|nr:GNAT family N-acetyltransferase [Salisediminibacterium haloalkalitolerans]SES09335.1 ElaA protein [Salisediminibacterium haloalkalitolerans]
MEWHVKRFEELTAKELYRILAARVAVFVVEQNCSYHETDNKDEAAIHIYVKDNEQITAYARILPPGYAYEAPSIGRVLVEKEQRRTGLGAVLMKKALEITVNEWDAEKVMIQAQTQAKSFYEGCGFETVSEMYLEDNIPHEDMVWTRPL